jgi:hypothetical protein
MSTTCCPSNACSLPPKTFRERIAHIERLTRDSLIAHRRDDLTLHLVYAADAAGQVRTLVDLERGCCGFLSFKLEEHVEGSRLTIVAPESARESAMLMFTHYLPKDPNEAAPYSAISVNGVCCPAPAFEGVQ